MRSRARKPAQWPYRLLTLAVIVATAGAVCLAEERVAHMVGPGYTRSLDSLEILGYTAYTLRVVSWRIAGAIQDIFALPLW